MRGCKTSIVCLPQCLEHCCVLRPRNKFSGVNMGVDTFSCMWTQLSLFCGDWGTSTGFISFKKYVLSNFYMPSSVLDIVLRCKDTHSLCPLIDKLIGEATGRKLNSKQKLNSIRRNVMRCVPDGGHVLMSLDVSFWVCSLFSCNSITQSRKSILVLMKLMNRKALRPLSVYWTSIYLLVMSEEGVVMHIAVGPRCPCRFAFTWCWGLSHALDSYVVLPLSTMRLEYQWMLYTGVWG